MKFEVLKKNNTKKIVIGLLIILLLIVCLIFKGSKAKYRSSQIIPLITNKKVTNKVPDFTTMGIFIKNSSGGYDERDTLPSEEGYVINQSKSSCTKFNPANNTSEPVTSAKLYTDTLGKHVIEGITKGSKCKIYLDKGFADPTSAKAQLLTKWGYTDMTTITERTDIGAARTDGGNKVYKAQDDDGWSYYLVGNPTKNWVKFGGYYWRIVRINGDGSIRMIYTGSAPKQITGAGTQLSNAEVASINADGNHPYNPTYNNASYVGYWYTVNEQFGLVNASPIHNVVNDFYNNKIANADKAYIDTNAGFCNDRSLAPNNPYGLNGGYKPTETTFFAARQRIYGSDGTNPTGPTLKCANQAKDLFTSKGASRGNKKLPNPIGLLTIDEANYAGIPSYWKGSTTGNYLYTARHYWTMSPFELWINGSGTPYAVVWFVHEGGYLTGTGVSNTGLGVRPVINLVKSVTFTSGDGTADTPFVIS